MMRHCCSTSSRPRAGSMKKSPTSSRTAMRVLRHRLAVASCRTQPQIVSSGRTNRHRLNRGGHRQANAALHRIVIVRLRHDERTRAYMRRRTSDGMSKAEVIRCLKRYVAREVFSTLRNTDHIAKTIP